MLRPLLIFVPAVGRRTTPPLRAKTGGADVKARTIATSPRQNLKVRVQVRWTMVRPESVRGSEEPIQAAWGEQAAPADRRWQTETRRLAAGRCSAEGAP